MISCILDDFRQFNFKFGDLPMIVIYDKPLDFPEYYVARLFSGDRATRYCVIHKSLEGILDAIPRSFVELGRTLDDDVKIITVFI